MVKFVVYSVSVYLVSIAWGAVGVVALVTVWLTHKRHGLA